VMAADIVLNVQDMVRLAPCLGKQVSVCAIENGIHDLCLSQPAPRQQMFNALKEWLGRLDATAAETELHTHHLS
jgi:alpha-beta hydrolase superfamily lysophospholipase